MLARALAQLFAYTLQNSGPHRGHQLVKYLLLNPGQTRRQLRSKSAEIGFGSAEETEFILNQLNHQGFVRAKRGASAAHSWVYFTGTPMRRLMKNMRTLFGGKMWPKDGPVPAQQAAKPIEAAAPQAAAAAATPEQQS